MLRIAPVERADDGLRDLRHFMDGAIAEVNHLLRMAQRPARIGSPRGVPRVRRGTGVFLLNGEPQAAIVNFTRKASVALPAEPAVPAFCGHPHFDLDRGIRARRRFHHDAAKRA